MILKASTRGSPTALARHLLNEQDNEHVAQHEVRGFMAQDVKGAMEEAHAMSKGVHSKQPLFSVSLSPPEQERVADKVFERAIDDIEEHNGLSGQPRIVVFHEKEGRRHAHAVWSRIDTEQMKVIPLPFYKNKLQEISKSIYLEQGWKLPDGYIDKTRRDPRNFDLAMYQQMKRESRDPKQVKAMAQEAWAISDNKEALQRALEERGLYLARGDRRSHVAMTWQGEVMSLPRLLGRKSKEVRERLGNADDLRGVADTREQIAKTVGPAIFKLIGQSERQRAQDMQPLDRERREMAQSHAQERQRMEAGQKARSEAETRDRAERMRKGLAGLMDRLTGRYSRLREQNEREAYSALVRDREQRQAMIDAQLAERRALQDRIKVVRQQHEQRIAGIHADLTKQREAIRQPSARLDWLQANHVSQRHKQAEQEVKHEAAPSRESQQNVKPDTLPRTERLQWLMDQQGRERAMESAAGLAPDSDFDLGPE